MPRKGQYAEIMAEYAEHIFRDNLLHTERGVFYSLPGDINREIDVVATLNDGEQIAMEVRDRKDVQNIDWVDQVVGKYTGSHFSAIWICTFDGCTLSSGAIKKLEHHGIGWRDFTLIDTITEEDSIPALFVQGLSLVDSQQELTVNGQIQTDLTLSYVDSLGGSGKMSFCKLVQNTFQQQASASYELLENTSYWIFEQTFEDVDSNFESKILNVSYQAPIKHHVFVDYFDEAYRVKDNGGSSSDILSTQSKSLFCVGNKLKINWSFFNRLEERGIVLKPSLQINIEAIPKKYRHMSKIDPIDIDGTGKKPITKVIGYRSADDHSPINS